MSEVGTISSADAVIDKLLTKTDYERTQIDPAPPTDWFCLRIDPWVWLRELSYVVLSAYAYMARACADPHYHPLFERAALEAQVDVDEERLAQLRAQLD